MKFSQRMGITPTIKEIQIEVMDDDLRIGLWNVFHLSFLVKLTEANYSSSGYLNYYEKAFGNSLWHIFFKAEVDTMPLKASDFREFIKRWFFKEADWYEVYDIIEYSNLYANSSDIYRFSPEKFEEELNDVLKREFSGYRIISNMIAPISNSCEVKELEDSFKITDSFSALKGCNIHLRAALGKLSDRIQPDYRNSIKESISAVESLAKIIAQRPNDSLGSSLDRIKGVINLHPSLERGFKQIYGYTSDEGGIRHALMDNPNCDFEDAKFMLISCSAFINYLIVKANKAGISLA